TPVGSHDPYEPAARVFNLVQRRVERVAVGDIHRAGIGAAVSPTNALRRGRRSRRRRVETEDMGALLRTVDPAPMLAASIDARISPGPSHRPATKKSALCRTKRAVHRPKATMPTK